MNCPFCNKSVSTTARYCPFCGKEMDVTFEEISKGLVSEEHSKKLEEKIQESRRVMTITAFLFAVSLIVFFAIPAPRLPEAVPVYRVRVPDAGDVISEQSEPPEFEIPQ